MVLIATELELDTDFMKELEVWHQTDLGPEVYYLSYLKEVT